MATLQRLGIDRPYVLAVGSLEPRKNLISLVDAMLQLPAEVRAGLSLVTAGPSGWKNRPIPRSSRAGERGAFDPTAGRGDAQRSGAPLQLRRSVRLPLLRRGLWPSGPRSYGVRCAGRHVQLLGAT